LNGEPVLRCLVRSGAYHDSVVLMRLQAALAGLAGIVDAAAVMGTPANRELLAASGMLAPEAERARPEDLLIVVKAEREAAATAALGQVDALLAMRGAAAADGAFRPRTLAAAAKLLPETRWVLISVPGRYAAAVAREALELGRNVFLYSDNVPVEDEVTLKGAAREQGLLVLGPDCGTAIVGGVGFGFANRVRRGSVGLVAASGTGLQAVASGIHALGAGVSQALGTGGRDLAAEVGGATAAQAIDLLARDPETKAIVLVSKPPDPAVAASLLRQLQATGKPAVVCLVGLVPPVRRLGTVHFAAGLDAAAEKAVELAVDVADVDEHQRHPERSEGSGWGSARYLRALFSGGTLAYELLLALRPLVSPLYSNLSSSAAGVLSLPDLGRSQGHTVLDLGDDELTVGRPHPMIDNTLRLRRLRQEATDPEVAVILLDVVLGEGAHPDPAAELAPAIAAARTAAAGEGRRLEVIALLVGTDEDPQGLERQAAAFGEAGARVVRTIEEAVNRWWILELGAGQGDAADRDSGEEGRGAATSLDDLAGPPAAINVGLESFYQSLVAQGATAVQVDWRPPAGGNERLQEILARMRT
jgi:FdrA protein